MMNDYSSIIRFNQKYYDYLINNDDVFENKSLNIIHHIWRVVLQFEIIDRIKQVCDIFINSQKENGEWGMRDRHHNFGDTVVNTHRLLWSLYVIQKHTDEKDYIEKIIRTISRSIDYIIENHDMHYNINRSFGHGMIDRLHYLIQTEYYLLAFDKDYHYLNGTQISKLEHYWAKDIEWIMQHQSEDGGWHEVDKVRSRIGSSADAVRGINLNDTCKTCLTHGVLFIIRNQNIYDGYWEAGNIDKTTDALKSLLNSRRIIDEPSIRSQIDDSIIKGTLWLITNFDNAEKLEENEYDLLTVTIDFERVIIKNEPIEFV